MDEGEFWSIIAAAKAAAGSDIEAREDTLRALLEERETEQVLAFEAIFGRLHAEAYRWDLWGAAYLMNGGCSDDGFMDFRSWLISEGEQVYRAALRDPDSLADLPPLNDAELEGIAYVAGRVLEERHVELPGGPRGPAAPAGQAWEEDDLAELFPRLAVLYD